MELTKTDCSEVLKKAGLRVTPQRIAICEAITNCKSHPTADEIYSQLIPSFPSMSLATIYNTLDVLVEMGLVNPLGNIGDSKVHFDGCMKPHVHLACTRCHQIFDYQSKFIEAMESDIHNHSGFDISGSRVVYLGLCPACQSNQTN